MPRYIGFDSHKAYAHVVELREDGKHLSYRVGLPDGLEAFKQRLDKDCQLVLEASTSTFRLADELTPHVGKLVVADPCQTRGAISRPATTDRNAAEALARLLASDFVRPVWVPPTEIRSLRSLVEIRVRLARLRTVSVNRIRALQRQELLPGLPALIEEQMLNQIDDDPYLQAYCSSLFRVKDTIFEECARLDAIFHAWCRESKDAKLLLSIPGVGPLVAACLISQIGDVKRFPTAKQLCSYAGMVPRVHVSGQTHRSGAIAKTGRRTLRWAMGIAASGAIKADGPFKEFREALCQRRPKAVAMLACARKLLTVVWRVWTTRQPYTGDGNEERYAQKLARLERAPRKKADSMSSQPPLNSPEGEKERRRMW